MSSDSNKNVDNPPDRGHIDEPEGNIAAVPDEVSSVAGSTKTYKSQQRVSTSSERQIKFERAQKCLENAALVSKRIKEHRKATAELLGRPFEDDDGRDTASDMTSIKSDRTSYSAATDTSATLSVQEALNIPGISESLANTLKQKEILMERIKQYKEISKRPIIKSSPVPKREALLPEIKESPRPKDNTDITLLQNKIKEKDNSLVVMQVKMKAMETTIVDLQEKLNEKDQLLEAKTKATSLMSDSLSKKDKDSLALLEDTRQQMCKMQENFIAMEAEWKEEKQRFLKDIQARDEKISNLVEANTILENARFEISVQHSELSEQLELKIKEIIQLQDKLNELRETPSDLPQNPPNDTEEEKGSKEIANMVELTKKVELLEQLNCQIRQTNKELENKLANIGAECKSPAAGSPIKKANSPVPTRKGGRNTAAKMKSPWSAMSSESLPQETDKKQKQNEAAKMENVIQSLNKDILDKEYIISQKDEQVSELNKLITEKDALLDELSRKQKGVSKVDVGVITEVTEIPIVPSSSRVDEVDSTNAEEPLETLGSLEDKLRLANDQIAALNEEIETANKNMIKVKSHQKLKLKQMQKTIDNFSKVSDTNAEIVKLNEELHQLSQKVAELEEEKGNLQLHLVDYDSGRMTESDAYKKMVEMETLAEARLKAISILEAQKFDLVQELHDLQQKNVEMEDKLADMTQLQNEQVCSEMRSVQLEEQIDNLTAIKKELELVIENLKLDIEHLNETIKHLQEEKADITHKLEHYIQENIELTDKLEKLSAEKVSSAESIEIVESLTTQEKLELEEYNKRIMDNKMEEEHRAVPFQEQLTQERSEIEKLVQESAELNKKIELFTQERQEVMERLNKIGAENESLQEKILQNNLNTSALQTNIDKLSKEKRELLLLNEDFVKQIEELKRERIDIMKESMDSNKPASNEDVREAIAQDTQTDDTKGDKGKDRTKNVKQLTKEILKLKNTIKEREAEIGDCQMKILSLEEQQQKQNESLQNNAAYEVKLKTLLEENNLLKEEITSYKNNKESENEIVKLRDNNELLQQEMLKIQQEYANTVHIRDVRVQELENLLLEYEKQIQNYDNTLQQKDKELVEYSNQISKLNEVSIKLKSTIDLLEEEKSKGQNAEIVKSLNKQITVYQKKLIEFEERLRFLEDEKVKLLNLKGVLENKNLSLEGELKTLQENLTEKQALIKKLQLLKERHNEEVAAIKLESKERDEEIHEIKLQLRKESIENEKLRTSLDERNNTINAHVTELTEIQEKLHTISQENKEIHEQFTIAENRNKELLEKLKKFAGNLKKKTVMYSELEGQLAESKHQVEQLTLQIESLPGVQEKLKYAEEELNRILSQKAQQEQQKCKDAIQFQNEYKTLQEKIAFTEKELSKGQEAYQAIVNELHLAHEHSHNLSSQIDLLNKKIVELEIEQKNNTNFVTKIQSLEYEITQKQLQVNELQNQIEHQGQSLNQLQYGQDAKVQERDLYIESLEAEIHKYKNRINRLEETISVMEDRRHSLERKADQLGSQLQEKEKAYSDYTSQEDELVGRLAALMDHDRFVEKQLHGIESENRELQYKIQNLNDEGEQLRKSLSELQDQCNTLKDKAARVEIAETNAVLYEERIRDLDGHLKKMTNDHQAMVAKSKHAIEQLETDFNIQIENSIKEKKTLSEKYEKLNEHVIQLEQKLQEYRSTIQDLNSNLEELNRLNQDLSERNNAEKPPVPDYTEQYISEINRLNAIINAKNQEVEEVSNKSNSLQTTLESQLMQLNDKLLHATYETEKLIADNKNTKDANQQLEALLHEKEIQFKQLMEEKTVSFEMSIPKTEGMIITSTFEPLNVYPISRACDVSSVESQIVSDVTAPSQPPTKVSDYFQNQPAAEESLEPVIVPKKAYLCYKGEEEAKVNVAEEIDPFNSDEGWGLGETEADSEQVMPGFTQFNDQILKLQTENDSLKSELASNNNKLMKALKKLKELKNCNDMLSNELKTAKQVSQSSFLDSAIEDELKVHIDELEKNINELHADLNKEKREKENIRKQNEVLHNANERLTEMKEKIDSEIELWKFKFKEANDKLSSLQWEGDSKTPEHKPTGPTDSNNKRLMEEIMKVEKENDDLQIILDECQSENKELKKLQSQLNDEINSLKNLLEQQRSNCISNDLMNSQLADLRIENAQLSESKLAIEKEMLNVNEKILSVEQLYSQAVTKCESIDALFQETKKQYEIDVKTLQEHYDILQEEANSLTMKLESAGTTTLNLNSQIEELKAKLVITEELKSASSQSSDAFMVAEKSSSIEDQFQQVKASLDQANDKLIQLENEKVESDIQIRELQEKLQHLNSENDQLLSTVTELRSSLSAAVDQRGFEIAELWKQHLAQREADFQKTEQELRMQLNALEKKYEELMNNVQSSTQEETNTLVMVEQINGLKTKLQDKDEHLTSLQCKYAEVISQLEMLRSEQDDEKILLENKLLGQQEEYEKLLSSVKEAQQESSAVDERRMADLQSDLATKENFNTKLVIELEESNRVRSELENNIKELTNQIRMKDTEVYQKTNDYSIAAAQRNEEFENIRRQLIDYEKKLEDLSFEKESELAILRLKLHENKEYYENTQKDCENEKAALTEELNAKILECGNLNRLVADLNKTLADHSSRIIEMQTALENQELEIVTLKDDLENLQELMRSSSSKIEKHVTFASDTKGTEEAESEARTQALLDPVPRAELDLALYMLHQRDVRCEEFTMELSQLLEERDTLQLRLSDSLRSYEELKMKFKAAGLDFSTAPSQDTVPDLPTVSFEREHQFVDTHRGQSSRSSSISDQDGDKPKLQAKLSELRSVRYSRDVILRQESEQRQIGMRLLHRDVAHLPPEAVQQLEQAHHTLSRDSQSTSTVLLNWLRGKSTPKVVHDM